MGPKLRASEGVAAPGGTATLHGENPFRRFIRISTSPDTEASQASEAEHGRKRGAEFFVAGGEAAEGFESGEEVLDAGALAVKMLVKGRLECSIGVHGYDGDAALLVHISTEGVAVVALVHEDAGTGSQMGGQEHA
jgi:hypothetical protein